MLSGGIVDTCYILVGASALQNGMSRLMQVSEGINFADAHARAVVVLGVPYPSVKDAKVTLKKQYNNHVLNQRRGLVTGDEWYNLQAYRAMNQVRCSACNRVLCTHCVCPVWRLQCRSEEKTGFCACVCMDRVLCPSIPQSLTSLLASHTPDA